MILLKQQLLRQKMTIKKLKDRLSTLSSDQHMSRDLNVNIPKLAKSVCGSIITRDCKEVLVQKNSLLVCSKYVREQIFCVRRRDKMVSAASSCI